MRKFEILEENLANDLLVIKARIKLKNLASDPKVRIKTIQILDALKEKYDIIGTIQSGEICNFSPSIKKQEDTWIFKIKKKRTRARRAKTQTPVKNNPPTDTKKTKPGNFGNRISKLATKIKEKEE